jgi:ectoine hydroxylase-related dioxygenase (phytanoyl-CoA dioxygenase family)
LTADGFVTLRGVLRKDECAALAELAAQASVGSAGTRCLLSLPWCQSLAAQLRRQPAIAALVPAEHVAAQCTYFEKSVARNWLVPIHQDLGIPVAARVDSPVLHGWSEKEGTRFVQPPVELLRELLAVRVHLDDCLQGDGPLQVVPGTHERGRIEPEAAAQARRAGPVIVCTLERGDALLMRPLLLHASSKASGASRRRVLHFLFGPRQLPHGLRWPHAV